MRQANLFDQIPDQNPAPRSAADDSALAQVQELCQRMGWSCCPAPGGDWGEWLRFMRLDLVLASDSGTVGDDQR